MSDLSFEQPEVEEESGRFREKYPGREGQIQKHPQVDLNKLARRWFIMMQTQNGDDFDDYGMAAENNKIDRYLGPWLPKDSDLLLLGVGTGREIAIAQDRGYNAVGTTLGKKNPTFAKERFDYTDKELFYGDNCTLPYPSGVFDAAAGFQFFEHVHAPYMFLTEMARILKPGGQLILEWPPHQSTNNGTLVVTEDPAPSNFMAEEDDNNLHHACCWTPAQANIMVKRCGFEDVEIYLNAYHGQEVKVFSKDPVPHMLMRIDEKDPAWFSGTSPSDIVVRAKRRPDHKMTNVLKSLMEAPEWDR